MAKKRTKCGEKDTRSRKVRDLPAKPVGARKAATVKGGFAELHITKVVDKSSAVLF
jgi:hypothetical protein